MDVFISAGTVPQDEVATQKAAVEALEDKRRLEAAAAVAAKRNSDAEASAAAERLATVRAAARDETNALQAQVASHRPHSTTHSPAPVAWSPPALQLWPWFRCIRQ